MNVVKLKLCTHMKNGLMYRVYRNQGQRPITLGVTFFDVLQFTINEKFSLQISQKL